MVWAWRSIRINTTLRVMERQAQAMTKCAGWAKTSGRWYEAVLAPRRTRTLPASLLVGGTIVALLLVVSMLAQHIAPALSL